MSKKICVIGTGYVGLITAIGLADFGNYVIGSDIDKNKIEKLKKGTSPIYEPGIEEYLIRNMKSNRLSFTIDIDNAIKESEVIFIAVGTPSSKNGDADLTYVMDVVKLIAKNINSYKIIVTKSTVPIGTNYKIKNIIRSITDKPFDVVSNPEFLREGKAIFDFFNPDRMIIGYESKKAKQTMSIVYRALIANQIPFVWCNIQTAEMIKYANNAFLATKIMFINQMANLAEQINADINLVSYALGLDSRISKEFLRPGPGYGGSCFPKDTKALVRIAEEHNVNMSLIKEVIRANEEQKLLIANKVINKAKVLNAETIAIFGLAFKAETDDMRGSPSIIIINELLKNGLKVKVTDPKAIDNAKIIFKDSIEYYDNEFDAVKDSDILLILTEWNEYKNIDLEKIKSLMKGNTIIDTRNIYDKKSVISLGFEYIGRGR